MNAIEIEEAISKLAEQPFDSNEFPYTFLKCFGKEDASIRRLRSGSNNNSDLGGVLQRNNIHIKVCTLGDVTSTLVALKNSPETSRAKAKFILATDGEVFEAEDLMNNEIISCEYSDFPNHFGFFLPLGGITTTKQIRESSFDIKATGRLNRLYVELLRGNPSWGTLERRRDMNHFMARLIFCFFAEDTDIFGGDDLLTNTIDQMSVRDASNTHEVVRTLFQMMNTNTADRATANLPRWAESFPYVNGGLFEGSTEVPRFSKIARSYLIHIGKLDWKKINPDIFGSMIQAVADDKERGELGMHYTSVPNILKVLSPLFLDDLRDKLEEAGTNSRTLLNLRARISKLRVFDPACGSGNFLVIAYKEMREIEAEINRRRNETGRKSDIPITNFRGIELRDFSAEIARLALIIAEYQCDVIYRGQRNALADFLPLDAQNWITCGNALRLDWLSICPPTGTSVKHRAEDLFQTSLDQAQIDFENEGGETYICGNPPYLGSQWQSPAQKEDMRHIFEGRTNNWKSLDLVAGWFMKAADYGIQTKAASALVSTNSICQGRQVENLWSLIIETGHEIFFAYTSFKWANLASQNAGVTVVIVGISHLPRGIRRIFSLDGSGDTIVKEAKNINPYLISGPNVLVHPESKPINALDEMSFGNMPNEKGHLLVSMLEADEAIEKHHVDRRLIRPFLGAQEFINGQQRFCIWVSEKEYQEANKNNWLNRRFEAVREARLASRRATTKQLASSPYRFGEVRQSGSEQTIIVPRVSSENRDYLPVGLAPKGTIIGDRNFALYDCPLWYVALIASRLHWVWIGTVCVRLEMRFTYTNTVGWNTFPMPTLTEKNRSDLTKCAEDILLAREEHYPATIAELYDTMKMPSNLRATHDRNDEVLERIYIGRQFRNDTERLEKLFELYTKMTTKVPTQ